MNADRKGKCSGDTLFGQGLMPEKERHCHGPSTHESEKQQVGYKIGESTKRNTADQCNSVLLLPSIKKVTHSD